ALAILEAHRGVDRPHPLVPRLVPQALDTTLDAGGQEHVERAGYHGAVAVVLAGLPKGILRRSLRPLRYGDVYVQGSGGDFVVDHAPETTCPLWAEALEQETRAALIQLGFNA